MPDWVCHTCGVVNLDGQRACESCGRERVSAPALPASTEAVAWEQCAWTTSGRRCQLVATLWTHPTGNYEFNKWGQVTKTIRPGYCIWHFECLSSPRLQEDFEEFERMQTIWLKRPYCNQLVHHPAEYVWSALRGIERERQDRMTVRPCNAHDCWVPGVLGTDGDGPALSVKESRARIAEIIRMLAETKAL